MNFSGVMVVKCKSDIGDSWIMVQIQKIDLCRRCVQCLFNNYTDRVFVTGHHGNQSLIHKYIFWDEIKLQRASAQAEIKTYLNELGIFSTNGIVPFRLTTALPRMKYWLPMIKI